MNAVFDACFADSKRRQDRALAPWCLWKTLQIWQQVQAVRTPAELSHLPPLGLKTPWNPLCNRQGSGATSAESYRSESSQRLWGSPGLEQGWLARTKVHPSGKCSKEEQMKLPPFCTSTLFPVPSSSTDFSLRVKMTPEPSLIMAYLVPNGQLCVDSVFFLSTLSTFLSGSSIRHYHTFFFPINILFQLLIPLFVTRVIHSAPSHSNLMTFR